jgi:hypothetical protein
MPLDQQREQTAFSKPLLKRALIIADKQQLYTQCPILSKIIASAEF